MAISIIEILYLFDNYFFAFPLYLFFTVLVVLFLIPAKTSLPDLQLFWHATVSSLKCDRRETSDWILLQYYAMPTSKKCRENWILKLSASLPFTLQAISSIFQLSSGNKCVIVQDETSVEYGNSEDRMENSRTRKLVWMQIWSLYWTER